MTSTNKQKVVLMWVGMPPPHPTLSSGPDPTNPTPYDSSVRPSGNPSVVVRVENDGSGNFQESYPIKISETEIWASDKDDGQYQDSKIIFE